MTRLSALEQWEWDRDEDVEVGKTAPVVLLMPRYHSPQVSLTCTDGASQARQRVVLIHRHCLLDCVPYLFSARQRAGVMHKAVPLANTLSSTSTDVNGRLSALIRRSACTSADAPLAQNGSCLIHTNQVAGRCHPNGRYIAELYALNSFRRNRSAP